MNRYFIITIGAGVAAIASFIIITLLNGAQSAPRASNWQLGRIDFATAITDGDAYRVKSIIKQSGEIHHVFINQQRTAVVFAFTPGILTTQGVLNNVKRGCKLQAAAYEVTEAQIESGCPVTGKQGILTRSVTFVKNFFN